MYFYNEKIFGFCAVDQHKKIMAKQFTNTWNIPYRKARKNHYMF